MDSAKVTFTLKKRGVYTFKVAFTGDVIETLDKNFSKPSEKKKLKLDIDAANKVDFCFPISIKLMFTSTLKLFMALT